MPGIDQILQQRMAVGRQDPQALMNSYQQNQSLMDLLALQKLKSDKEAAQRELAMQAGQGEMPTVKDQREQEMLEMTKRELAQQVGGVGDQQMAQQQDAMQKLMSGIASQPTPPVTGMAQGGIVGYKTGGDVEEEEAAVRARNIIREQELVAAGVPEAEARRIAREEKYQGMGERAVSDIQQLITSPQRMGRWWQENVARPGQAALGLDAPAQLIRGMVSPAERGASPEEVAARYAAPAVPAVETVDPLAAIQSQLGAASQPNLPQAEPAAQPTAMGGIADLSGDNIPSLPQPDKLTSSVDPRVETILGERIQTDPAQARAAREADLRERLAGDEKLTARRAGREGIEALLERNRDPSRQRMDALINFGLGAAGGSNIASALTGGGMGVQQGRATREAEEERLMGEVRRALESEQAFELDLEREIFGTGERAEGRADEMVSGTIDNLTNLQDIERLTDQFNISTQQARDIAEFNRVMSMIDAGLKRAELTNVRTDQLERIRQNYYKMMQDARTDLEESYQMELGSLRSTIRDPSATRKQREEAQTKLDSIDAEIGKAYAERTRGLKAEVDALAQQIDTLLGRESSGTSDAQQRYSYDAQGNRIQ